MIYKNNFVPGSTDNPAIDGAFVIISAFIVFTMQTGFGLLESGLVRARSESNVFVRCLLDLVIGGTAYWALGFGISFGTTGNPFIGTNHFFLDGIVETDPTLFLKFFFQFAFAAAATTIVSGAVTERIRLKQYIIFTFFNTAFTYPVICHWMWDKKGWLNRLGAYDFAGGCVVHVTGGASALMGAIILGPRYGRFDKSRANEFLPSKPMNIIVGTFLLWFGWIGFNCGSTFGVTGGMWRVTASTAVVTTLGPCGGGIAAILLSYILERKRKYFLNIGEFASGVLAGLVAVTAMASQTRPAEGFFVGMIGGWISVGMIYLMEYLKVDDPVGCFAIHWAAGAWGMIAVGFLAERDNVIGLVSRNGVLRGGDGYLLAINFLAVVCITLFSALMTTIYLFVMNFTIGLRLSEVDEKKGADFVEHGILQIILPLHLPNNDEEKSDDIADEAEPFFMTDMNET